MKKNIIIGLIVACSIFSTVKPVKAATSCDYYQASVEASQNYLCIDYWFSAYWQSGFPNMYGCDNSVQQALIFYIIDREQSVPGYTWENVALDTIGWLSARAAG